MVLKSGLLIVVMELQHISSVDPLQSVLRTGVVDAVTLLAKAMAAMNETRDL